MSLVVSDTSPLRCLDHLAEMSLLRDMYGSVLIPPAVAQELSSPSRAVKPVDLTLYSFVTVQSPTDRVLVQQLATRLDPGESEAIVLAIQVKATALLMDEAKGRTAAQARGLACIGVMGILARAKFEGRITDVRSRLDRLRKEIQFWIATPLYEQFLKSIGE
jgi:uncharacterized protein